MYAIEGDGGASAYAARLDRLRRRLRSRLPLVAARVELQLRLARVALGGPDPEAALVRLARAHRTLSAFLKTTPGT